MNKVTVPQGYRPILNSYETQLAIGMIKRLFADVLSGQLNLRRVSAPLFLEASTGLNDDLNGVERPVSFDIKATGQVEAPGAEGLRVPDWQRVIYRHERNPPGRGSG